MTQKWYHIDVVYVTAPSFAEILVLFNIIIICDMCQPCRHVYRIYMADMKFLAKWTEGE